MPGSLEQVQDSRHSQVDTQVQPDAKHPGASKTAMTWKTGEALRALIQLGGSPVALAQSASVTAMKELGKRGRSYLFATALVKGYLLGCKDKHRIPALSSLLNAEGLVAHVKSDRGSLVDDGYANQRKSRLSLRWSNYPLIAVAPILDDRRERNEGFSPVK